MYYPTLVLLGLLGLVFGSFLSALTYRLPRGVKTTKGRSKCTSCKKTIDAQDNIPLLSFLFLRGKCRHCGKSINFRYPLIELGTAALFVLTYFFSANVNLSFSFLTLPYLLFVVLITFAIFIIDLENLIIPDELVFWGFGVTLTLFVLFDYPMIFGRLLSAFLSALFLLLIHLMTKGKGMGLGDVKFALFVGLVLGASNSFVWLFLAFLTGAVAGIILILSGKARFGKPIPFGPFLAFSFLVALFWGNKLASLFGI